MSNELSNWADIKALYKNSPLLLGNGFSLNFSETLNYKFLHKTFIENCSPNAKLIFDDFQTQNFEIILRNLEISERVNNILALSIAEIKDLQKEVRNGLIDAIRLIHPTHDKIDFGQTKYVSEQLKYFSDIFTTNYDLYSYYLILDTKYFGDYFFGAYNDKYNKFRRPDEMNNHHIYYLHGALFLFTDEVTSLKIKGHGSYLLDLITGQINQADYPLFISEGTSISKLKEINSNQYLLYCFDHFSLNKDKNLVVFGQSLSEQDFHIAEAMDNNYKNIAISIKPELFNSLGHLKAEKNRIASLFKKSNLTFYDANTLFTFKDPGTILNPAF